MELLNEHPGAQLYSHFLASPDPLRVFLGSSHCMSARLFRTSSRMKDDIPHTVHVSRKIQEGNTEKHKLSNQ